MSIVLSTSKFNLFLSFWILPVSVFHDKSQFSVSFFVFVFLLFFVNFLILRCFDFFSLTYFHFKEMIIYSRKLVIYSCYPFRKFLELFNKQVFRRFNLSNGCLTTNQVFFTSLPIFSLINIKMKMLTFFWQQLR